MLLYRHGIIGYALMTSATVGDLLKVLVQYHRLLTRDVKFELQNQGDFVALKAITEDTLSRQGTGFFIERYFASVHVCATFLLPELRYFDSQQFTSTRVRERGMRRFKSVIQAQGFLNTPAAVSNLFNLGRHLISANHYRDPWEGAFNECDRAVA